MENDNLNNETKKESVIQSTDTGNVENAPATPSQLELEYIQKIVGDIKTEIQKVIIGNSNLLELMLSGLFSGGHILLEGVPGVAKTLMAKLISQSMNLSFKRIQFTPDLLPSDLIGVSIYNMQKAEFYFKRGPLFSNLILIDEINRSPAKTQAALFEAMEEKQITVDGETHALPQPFFVLATQNPIEQEGTYRLPEAQLDRFMFRLKITYPDLENEIAILQRFKSDFNQSKLEKIKPVIDSFSIAKCIDIIERIHIKDELITYIASIVHQTRNNGSLYMGASPRASLAILKTSKALAIIRGRDFVTPDDIQSVAYPVLNHRIILSPEKEMEGLTSEQIIKEMISAIEVPR